MSKCQQVSLTETRTFGGRTLGSSGQSDSYPKRASLGHRPHRGRRERSGVAKLLSSPLAVANTSAQAETWLLRRLWDSWR